MLEEVCAVRFHKKMNSGKTNPCILTCQRQDGTEVELVAKFKAGCERRSRSLTNEAIASLLAADLSLPTPEPFIVRIDAAFAEIIPASNEAVRSLAKKSVGLNFGVKKLPPNYMIPPKNIGLPKNLVPLAGEILAFDTFIDNPGPSH